MHNLEADEKEEQRIQQVDVSAKKREIREPVVWLDSHRSATGNTTRKLQPRSIDGDVDKYFCPGCGGRTYPHQKFNDKEAQGSERDQRPVAGTGGGRAYHWKKFQDEVRDSE